MLLRALACIPESPCRYTAEDLPWRLGRLPQIDGVPEQVLPDHRKYHSGTWWQGRYLWCPDRVHKGAFPRSSAQVDFRNTLTQLAFLIATSPKLVSFNPTNFLHTNPLPQGEQKWPYTYLSTQTSLLRPGESFKVDGGWHQLGPAFFGTPEGRSECTIRQKAARGSHRSSREEKRLCKSNSNIEMQSPKVSSKVEFLAGFLMVPLVSHGTIGFFIRGERIVEHWIKSRCFS